MEEVKMMSNIKSYNNQDKNLLVLGDNLEVLSNIESNSVDLIYIDPPFFSNRNYEVVWGDEAEIRAFEDRFDGDVNVYINWMHPRIQEIYRILKSTGSFYLHCDWHASHYLKVMCDKIFGYKNFRNEIIWGYGAGGSSKRHFPRKHDNILFYTKTDKHIFNHTNTNLRVPFNQSTVDFHFKDRDENGRRFRVQRKNGKEYKKYEDEGKLIPDYWTDIGGQEATSPLSKEYTGYPTQKPERLLARIIEASSNKGDVVLDAFCGCGTALIVAQKLGRRWIGVDISPSAIALVARRIEDTEILTPGFEIVGMPTTTEDLAKLKPYEFQYWVINAMGATPSPKKSGDMGIDGFSFLNTYPIQVKQNKGGRNAVDNFETALRRYYGKTNKPIAGLLVAMGFTKGAKKEVERARVEENIFINLVDVKQVLYKEFKPAMKIDVDEDQVVLELMEQV